MRVPQASDLDLATSLQIRGVDQRDDESITRRRVDLIESDLDSLESSRYYSTVCVELRPSPSRSLEKWDMIRPRAGVLL